MSNHDTQPLVREIDFSGFVSLAYVDAQRIVAHVRELWPKLSWQEATPEGFLGRFRSDALFFAWLRLRYYAEHLEDPLNEGRVKDVRHQWRVLQQWEVDMVRLVDDVTSTASV